MTQKQKFKKVLKKAQLEKCETWYFILFRFFIWLCSHGFSWFKNEKGKCFDFIWNKKFKKCFCFFMTQVFAFLKRTCVKIFWILLVHHLQDSIFDRNFMLFGVSSSSRNCIDRAKFVNFDCGIAPFKLDNCGCEHTKSAKKLRLPTFAIIVEKIAKV